MQTVQVLVSAVSDEFRSYRDYLRGLLKRPNVDVHIQEDFIPTGTETLDKLDSYIAQSSAVIHLAGDMTGSFAGPPVLQSLRARYIDLADRLAPLKASLKSGDPPLSYTQWEAYLAIYHCKPLVLAVPKPGAPRDAAYWVDAQQQASQRAHLDRLCALGRYAEISFGSAEQLAVQVLRSSILDLLAKAGVVTPIMRVFEVFREIARSLLERSDRLRKAEGQRRIDMADLFEKISGCLTAVSTEIRAGGVPHERCGQLVGYAELLPKRVGKELRNKEAKNLGDKLLSAYNVEGIAMSLQDVTNAAEKEPYLKQIAEASGYFQALADIVKTDDGG